MTVATAIANLQTKALSLSGIKDAPVNPPESANAYPFAVSYPRQGNLQTASAGWGNYFHTLYTEFHFSRAVLPAAVAAAIPYIESFAALLVNDPQLANTVQEVRALRYTFGKLEWGGVETIGIRFEIDVKATQTT